MTARSELDGGQVVLFRTPDGKAELDVRLDGDTVWLTQKQMADLFAKDADTIGLHIANIYKEEELVKRPTAEDYAVVHRRRTGSVT